MNYPHLIHYRGNLVGGGQSPSSAWRHNYQRYIAREKRQDYMSLIELQKLDKTGELLGIRHSHRAAVFLHVAISLSTLGAVPLKTTS